jgi:hypothetical protein
MSVMAATNAASAIACAPTHQWLPSYQHASMLPLPPHSLSGPSGPAVAVEPEPQHAQQRPLAAAPLPTCVPSLQHPAHVTTPHVPQQWTPLDYRAPRKVSHTALLLTGAARVPLSTPTLPLPPPAPASNPRSRSRHGRPNQNRPTTSSPSSATTPPAPPPPSPPSPACARRASSSSRTTSFFTVYTGA